MRLELLSKYAKTFDSSFTLLHKDVNAYNVQSASGPLTVVSFHIKSPKIGRLGVGDNVEIFSLQSPTCPVAALQRYKQMVAAAGHAEDSATPFFRQENGANYHKTLFNTFQKSFNYSIF